MTSKVLFLLCFILLIPNKIFGQTDFYFSISGTYSFIPSAEMTARSPGILGYQKSKLTESFDVKPGLNFGVGFNRQLKKRFSFSSGIGFSFHQFTKNTNLDFTETSESECLNYGFYNSWDDIYNTTQFDDTQCDGTVPFITPNEEVVSKSNDGKTKILYLAIPVKIYYALIPDRFNIGIGITNYLVAYSSQIRAYYGSPFTNTYKEYNDKSSKLSTEWKFVAGIQINQEYLATL